MATSSRNRSLTALFAWHGLVLLFLVCLPLLKYHNWWWHLRRNDLLPLIVLLGAYGASGLAVVMFVSTEGWRAALRALGITLSVFCLILIAALQVKFSLPRYLLLPMTQ